MPLKDQSGWEPLHNAAMDGCPACCERLIEAGADISAAIPDGSEPLHLAAMEGHKDVVSLLIKAGASVNALDAEGRTPLHWAIFGGHTESAATLIEAGADVSAEDVRGRTPFACPPKIRLKRTEKIMTHREKLLSHLAKLGELIPDGCTHIAAYGSACPEDFIMVQGRAVYTWQNEVVNGRSMRSWTDSGSREELKDEVLPISLLTEGELAEFKAPALERKNRALGADILGRLISQHPLESSHLVGHLSLTRVYEWEGAQYPIPADLTADLRRVVSIYQACGLVFVYTEYKIGIEDGHLIPWSRDPETGLWVGTPPFDHDDLTVVGHEALGIEEEEAERLFREAFPELNS